MKLFIWLVLTLVQVYAAKELSVYDHTQNQCGVIETLKPGEYVHICGCEGWADTSPGLIHHWDYWVKENMPRIAKEAEKQRPRRPYENMFQKAFQEMLNKDGEEYEKAVKAMEDEDAWTYTWGEKYGEYGNFRLDPYACGSWVVADEHHHETSLGMWDSNISRPSFKAPELPRVEVVYTELDDGSCSRSFIYH